MALQMIGDWTYPQSQCIHFLLGEHQIQSQWFWCFQCGYPQAHSRLSCPGEQSLEIHRTAALPLSASETCKTSHQCHTMLVPSKTKGLTHVKWWIKLFYCQIPTKLYLWAMCSSRHPRSVMKSKRSWQGWGLSKMMRKPRPGSSNQSNIRMTPVWVLAGFGPPPRRRSRAISIGTRFGSSGCDRERDRD